MSQICPKAANCPIFTGVLKESGFGNTYKQLYCENGEKGRNTCKRFQVASKVGKCPPNLLPNSIKSVDEIVSEMKIKGLV